MRHHVIECTTGCTTACSPPESSTPLPNAPRPTECPSALLTRSIHCAAVMQDRTNDAPTDAIPSQAPPFGNRLPKKRMTRNESAGSATTIQTESSIIG